MFSRFFLLCGLAFVSSGQFSATAEDFFVGDSNVTVTNTLINAGGLSAGDSVTFQGNIVTAGDGVFIFPVPSGVSLLFNATSNIIAGTPSGVVIDGAFNGRFINYGMIIGEDFGVDLQDLTGGVTNYGTIRGRSGAGVRLEGLMGTFTNYGVIRGGTIGVLINGPLTGVFTNSGTISGTLGGVFIPDSLTGTFNNSGTISGFSTTGPLTGVFNNSGTISRSAFINDALMGMFNNSGVINGGDDAVNVRELFGEVFNCGIIASDLTGIDVSNATGTIRNDGGRISGGVRAINLGTANGTVVLSGPSHIVGGIDGGGGTDTLRFENMRGINAAKQAELAALAAADPAAGTVTLFGETMNWLNFEDIQADAASLVAYQSLVVDQGLQGYASSLDNVTGLNDSFRQLLKELNNVDGALLDQALSNASGQSVVNALSDMAREQDTNFFHLFSNQFSSLRGNVSGSLASNQSNQVQGSGLFTQDMQAGAGAGPSDQIDTWVLSYVGNGRQDANGSRAEADYDNTSFLFGRGTEINENWYLGGFGGYTRSEGQIDGFGSYLENKGGWIGANAQFQHGDVFANFAGGMGFQDIKSIRRDIVGNRMQGDTGSLGGFFYSQIGRDFFFGEEKETRVSPYAGLTLSAQAIDAYNEQGPTGTSLRFADETLTTVQTVLGVAATQYRDTEKGWLRLRSDLAWWHAYGGEETYSAGLVAPGLLNGFNVTSPEANGNRGVIQLGIEFGFDRLENWVFQAGYVGVVGEDDYASHGGTFGARVSF